MTQNTQNQIFEPRIFPRGGDNLLIINTMKNLFLQIFHLADYQLVTRMIKQYLGKGV